jgi:hypothetical protein
MSRRGRTVAGTSAKKNRHARRQPRGEADRLRRAGAAAPPPAVVDVEDLEVLAASTASSRRPPMADRLRPEVVAALTSTPPVPAEVVDQVLDASDAEREAAAAELLDSTRAFLEQTGALKRSASVLDLRHDQLALLAAAYGFVYPWWAQPGYRDRPLGDLLKVVPTTVAAQAMRALRAAGFLPPDKPD